MSIENSGLQQIKVMYFNILIFFECIFFFVIAYITIVLDAYPI